MVPMTQEEVWCAPNLRSTLCSHNTAPTNINTLMNVRHLADELFPSFVQQKKEDAPPISQNATSGFA